jgi:predicted transcriptional regulator
MAKQTTKNSADKTNLTLKLDTALVRALKIVAAKRGSSISALVRNNLEQIVNEEDEYQRAKRRAIARMEEGWALGWQKPKSRDELHER